MAQAPAQACSSEVQRTFNLIKTRLVVDKGAIESWLSGTNHHSSLSVATEASYQDLEGDKGAVREGVQQY